MARKEMYRSYKLSTSLRVIQKKQHDNDSNHEALLECQHVRKWVIKRVNKNVCV